MTAVAVKPLQVGDCIPVASRSVKCSNCSVPTPVPVFMGRSADDLPLWWCAQCRLRHGAVAAS